MSHCSRWLTIICRIPEGNKVFHEGHRVNFKYLIKHKIKADVSILTAEESKLLGIIQLGMNFKNTIKASKLLESKHLFITGNQPEKTEGFIGKFIKTKTYDLDELSKNINVYINEGDLYNFNGE